MSRPLGIVLAGGASSRFGRDKVTAELDGRPLVHHALERLAQVADRIVLVLAPGVRVPRLPPALVDRIDIAHDAAAHQGPLAGLAAALDAALDAPSTALVVGADMPRLHPEVLALLASTLTEYPSAGAVILESDPPATLPMAIDVDLARLAANALLAEDRRSLHGLLDALHAVVIPAATWRALDPDAQTLDDIDLPSDAERRRT
jgi:molybdopterin-guanine dinucleotide biosynthesis protein A